MIIAKQLDICSLQQFELVFHRPDIVLKQFANPSAGQVIKYTELHRQHLHEMGFTEENLSYDLDAPYVEIDWKKLPAVSTQKNINIDITASDDKYALNRITILINNKPNGGSEGLSLKELGIKKLSKTMAVSLEPGKNKIQISAYNEKGIESIKETVFITYSN